jgi:hypothetical protein
MRGRRPGKTGGVFAGIQRGFFRGENDADGRRSFAAVERSLSDRLPATMMTHPRIHSLWGAVNIGGGLIHSHLRDDQRGVRLFLQCVCVQLIAFLFDQL